MAWLGCEEKITLEPSSSLTQSLIDDDEYEKGVLFTEVIQRDGRFGAVHHTLTVKPKVISEPRSKKQNCPVDKFNHG